MDRREEESELEVLSVLLAPRCGASVPRGAPSSPPGEFCGSISRKTRAASATQEERPEHRNPGAAPELGEGRLAGSGAWCQEPGLGGISWAESRVGG